MKKIISGLVSCALMFTLAACGSDTTDGSTTDKSETNVSSTEDLSSELSDGSTEAETESETDTDAETDAETEPADESEAPIESEETPVDSDADTDTDEGTDSSADLSASNDTVVLLENIWASLPEDQQFPSAGGDYNHSVMGGPGYVDNEDSNYLCNTLLFPADYTDAVVEAASVGHMMNQNNFTSGLITLAEGTDTAAITAAFEEIVETNHWLCGIPEEYMLLDLGENQIFIAYGFSDNIANIKTHLNSHFDQVTVLTEGSIV